MDLIRCSGENEALTMTTFHSKSRTFFMGKWGAKPLQNLVTMEKSRRAKGSSLCMKKPEGSGERQARSEDEVIETLPL